MNERDYLAERFEEHRTHLRAVAYRMLGSLSEVDDAVQEAWLRLSRADATGIDNLGGWLTTVVARVCLDMLRSRQSRREEPFTPDAPEPVATGTRGSSPEQEALLADSVGLALLVVLDRLTPAERLAFVLHDMFAVPFEEIAPIVGRSAEATRQLASRARRRVRGGAAAPDPDLVRQREVVDAFLAALRGGDFEGLLAVLDPDLVVRADMPVPSGAPAEIRGAAVWAKRAVAYGHLARLTRPALVNGAIGVVVAPRGRLVQSAPLHDRERQDHRDRGHRQSGAARRARRVDRRLTRNPASQGTSSRRFYVFPGMTIVQTGERSPRKPLRLWPGVIAAVVLGLARFGVKAVIPGFAGFALGMQWALGAAGAVVLWWLLFSRARWLDRVGAIVLMIAGLAATWFLRHDSMGPAWLFAYAVPILCFAFVAWAGASRRLAEGPRRATMAATILLACGVWTLVRMEGITGDHVITFDWRWAKSAEERLAGAGPGTSAAAAPADRPVVSEPGVTTRAEGPAVTERALRRVEWPGFRGPERDGISRGVRIETNWSASPPVELWRRPIGPGWSSFAVPAIASTRRSSAVTTRPSPVTTRPPARRCGRIETRPDSSSRTLAQAHAGRRPSATVACTRSARPES